MGATELTKRASSSGGNGGGAARRAAKAGERAMTADRRRRGPDDGRADFRGGWGWRAAGVGAGTISVLRGQIFGLKPAVSWRGAGDRHLHSPRIRDQERPCPLLLFCHTDRGATYQPICALPMPTCQDIHFFNRLIVTPLPPWPYSSLAVAVAYGGGLGGRALAFPGTRSGINLLMPKQPKRVGAIDLKTTWHLCVARMALA